MRAFKSTALLLSALILCAGTLVSCSGGDEKPRLEGERLSVLELEKSLEPDNPKAAQAGFALPSAWRNEFWPQAGGYPNHAMQHVALPANDGALKKLWSADIGAGSSKTIPLTAQPIVIDGRIFTLDTDAHLTAFNIENGKKIWRSDLGSKTEKERVITGGIGYSNGTLFITNGYSEIIAVNPANGVIKWRNNLIAPSRSAPTIMGGRIFITTLDNRLLALNERDGSLLWQYQGITEETGLIGTAAPAANHDIVVPVFSSGEVSALRVENGSVAWSDNLSNLVKLGALSGIGDIKAMPVIDQGLVFAISFSGKMVAIDERTGARVWQRSLGGSETPWLAGNHFFVITSNNELAALQRTNGEIIWVQQLPRYENPEKRKDAILWTGPLLAGDHLIIANNVGEIVMANPQNGQILNTIKTGANISLAPIVAGERLYILSDDGRLIAFE